MSSSTYKRGDVVWAVDPFREKSNPRPWLILATDSLPYPKEDYICVVITTSDIPQNFKIGDSWVKGKNPNKTSYCSPWNIATIKQENIRNSQGKVTEQFTQNMVDKCKKYLNED